MRYALTLLLLTACVTAYSQPTSAVDLFFIDPVGREYLLLTDGSLVTDNPLGQNRFAFFDSSRGRPDVVDVTNPFAILLYYADYGETIILDRTLSELRRLDFFSIAGVEQPVTLARATDGGIWLFDSWDYRLKLLDQNGEIGRTSNDLRLELKITTEPTAIYVYENLVLLHFTEDNRTAKNETTDNETTDNGLAVFTNYGRFQRWFPLAEGTDFTWLDGRLAAVHNGVRWVYDLRTDRTVNRPATGDSAEKDSGGGPLDEGKRAGTRVRGTVNERWLPTAKGFRRFNPVTNRTEPVEF